MSRLKTSVLTGCFIIVLCGLSLSHGFLDLCARDAFFAITLASTTIVFLHVRPWLEYWQLAVVSSALVVLEHFGSDLGLKWAVLAGLVGVSSLGLLAIRLLWSAAEQRRRLWYAFFPPLLLVLAGYVGAAPMEITDRLHPKTFDLCLYVFDGSLGFQPSFVVGQWVLAWRWLARLMQVCYYLLPAVLMLVYARQLTRKLNVAMQAFLAFFLAGPLGVICYNLLPACGPIYLVGAKFPLAPVSIHLLSELALAPIAIAGTRNAFPSLHLGWALLAWWYSEGTSAWVRGFVLVFLMGTAIATLGLGEHYFVDLVAAFPFAVAVEAGCRLEMGLAERDRWGPMVGGSALLFGWIILLRFAPRVALISPMISWGLVICTLAACGMLRRHSRPRSNVAVNAEDKASMAPFRL